VPHRLQNMPDSRDAQAGQAMSTGAGVVMTRRSLAHVAVGIRDALAPLLPGVAVHATRMPKRSIRDRTRPGGMA
jgi:hypothetical protein